MQQPGPPSTPDERSEATPVLRGRQVLLVAADGFDRLVANELLEGGAGASVVIADGVRQALELLRVQRVDAILLDLDLPGGEGAEMARRLHARGSDADHGGRCPVVAMVEPGGTAWAPGATDGVAERVAKPLHPATLFAAFARCMPPIVGAGAPDPAQTAAAAVSFAIGLERCLGRRDLYARVAQRFLEQGRESVQGIGDALTRGDRKTAARLAHSLISTAGTLGAMSLSEGARALYAALAEGGKDEAAPLEALAAEADRVRDELRRHLREAATEAGNDGG